MRRIGCVFSDECNLSSDNSAAEMIVAALPPGRGRPQRYKN